MLKYLIVQLDSCSTSFCHYLSEGVGKFLMPEIVLRRSIVWAQKRNLSLHFLLPDYRLPASYEKEMMRHESVMISSSCSYYASLAQIVVYQTIGDYIKSSSFDAKIDIVLVPPTDIQLLSQISYSRLALSSRLNVVLQGIERFTEDDITSYKTSLSSFSNTLLSVYKNKGITQVNLLTDILFTDRMNNCGAGVESITIAPNGRFYVCPGFYCEDANNSVGEIDSELQMYNSQLYTLQYAPICKICDTYHCRRCIWLNHKMTGEVNTPSRQQCVVSHIERNQSQLLLNQIRELDPAFASEKDFKTIDYLDPFELFRRN